jgi:hypothetical protein
MSQTILALPRLLNACPAPAAEPTAPPGEPERRNSIGLSPRVRGRIQAGPRPLGAREALGATTEGADGKRPCRS